MDTQPIIQEIEVREQDNRASLRAAWKRVQYDRTRRCITDLHVREFCFFVFAKDLRGDGVQLSYEEIAKELECTYKTARNVVQRAAAEFGLIATTEARYVTGCQAANRYSIDWPVVRSINLGRMSVADRTAASSGQVPASSGQGPASSGQGPASSGQHNKEVPTLLPRPLPRPLPTHHCESSDAPQTGSPDSWDVVVSRFDGLGMAKSAGAVEAVRRRGKTIGYVIDLVDRWERLRARHPGKVTVAWLFRWCTGESEPPAEGDPLRRKQSSPSYQEVGF